MRNTSRHHPQLTSVFAFASLAMRLLLPADTASPHSSRPSRLPPGEKIDDFEISQQHFFLSRPPFPHPVFLAVRLIRFWSSSHQSRQSNPLCFRHQPSHRCSRRPGFYRHRPRRRFCLPVCRFLGNHPLVTTFVSRGKLTALVPANLIAAGGTGWITVSTAAPGGGISNTAFLQVGSPVTVYSPTMFSLTTKTVWSTSSCSATSRAAGLAFAALLLTFIAAGITACGSDSSSTRTPSGAYTVTVTATSGSLSNSTTANMTVQ